MRRFCLCFIILLMASCSSRADTGSSESEPTIVINITIPNAETKLMIACGKVRRYAEVGPPYDEWPGLVRVCDILQKLRPGSAGHDALPEGQKSDFLYAPHYADMLYRFIEAWELVMWTYGKRKSTFPRAWYEKRVTDPKWHSGYVLARRVFFRGYVLEKTSLEGITITLEDFTNWYVASFRGISITENGEPI